MKTDVLLAVMSICCADMRAAALAAQDARFDWVWTGDHLRDPDGMATSECPRPGANIRR